MLMMEPLSTWALMASGLMGRVPSASMYCQKTRRSCMALATMQTPSRPGKTWGPKKAAHMVARGNVEWGHEVTMLWR